MGYYRRHIFPINIYYICTRILTILINKMISARFRVVGGFFPSLLSKGMLECCYGFIFYIFLHVLNQLSMQRGVKGGGVSVVSVAPGEG